MRKSIVLLNTLLLVVSAVMTACAQGQGKFTVSGKTAEKSKKIIVLNLERRDFQDSAVVNNGEFSYTAKNVGRETYLLFVDNDTRSQTVVVIEADGAAPEVDMTKQVATGTPLNDELTSLTNKLNEIQSEYAALKKRYDAASEEQRKLVADTMSGYGKRVEKAFCEVIDRNQNNTLPALLLVQICQTMDFNRLMQYAESGKVYTKCAMFQPVKEYVDYMKPSMAFLGKKFTDVSGKDFYGKQHNLSEYVGKGNYVLVDFWASWCGPCMREMPNVKACWEKYKAKGFNVVGVSLDNDAAKWRSAVDGGGYAWPQISDLSGWKSAAAKAYGVQSIPWNFLCDGDGTIVAVSLRAEQLAAKLAEVYGE